MSVVKLCSQSLIALSVLGLTACGGGSDNGGSATPSTTPTQQTDNAPIVSNPIADENAKVGENYNFDIPENTCTDADGDAITYTINKLSNGSGLSLVNFKTLTGSPTRPGVVSVTVTCTAGTTSASDEFIITITEDNIAPTVNAGVDQTVTAGDTVTLTAIATDSNTDGSIVSYSWQQEAADINVDTIINSDQSIASFIAPDVDNTQTLTFTVQVTDNAGAISSDMVTIDILSKNTPEITINFPLAFGITTGDEIDVVGEVTTKNDATLSTVIITANDTSYNAIIDNNGSSWRATNVDITNADSMTITATDSKGLTGSSVLALSNDLTTATTIDNDIVDMALDADNNIMYIQTSGFTVADIKTYAVDLTNGTSKTLVITDTDSSFSNAQRYSFAFDKTNKQLLTGVSDGASSAILATNIATLERTILSSDLIGSGPFMGLPADIILNNKGGAFVIDNENNQILSLELVTGKRTLLADSTASPKAIETPLAGIFNVNNDDLIVTTNSLFKSEFQYVDTATINNVAIIDGTLNDTVTDLAIDNKNNVIYFMDGSDNLTSIDLDTQVTTIIIDSIIKDFNPSKRTDGVGLEFNSENNLLYIVGSSSDDFKNIVIVVEPVSGDYVRL